LEPSEALLGPAVSDIGPSRVVFGTDFPHPDQGTSMLGELLGRRSLLGDDVLREILWENPRRLTGLASATTT
jgi:predicted TIM-barrel fold metal-dependent hydrolase